MKKQPFVFVSYGLLKGLEPKHRYSRIDRISLNSPTKWETVVLLDDDSKKALRGMAYVQNLGKSGGLIILNGVSGKKGGEIYSLKRKSMKKNDLIVTDLKKRTGFIDNNDGNTNSHPYQIAIGENNSLFVSLQNTGETGDQVYIAIKNIGILIFDEDKENNDSPPQTSIPFPNDIIGMCVSIEEGKLYFSSVGSVYVINLKENINSSTKPTVLFSVKGENHLAGVGVYNDYVCVVGWKSEALTIYSLKKNKIIHTIPILLPEKSLPEQLCIVEM